MILNVSLGINAMRVYIDISKYWLRDDDGELKTVNSVYEDIKDSTNKVGRNTLRLALDGKLDRGHFSNQIKLARLCSMWAGQRVSVLDLMRIEDEDEEGDIDD